MEYDNQEKSIPELELNEEGKSNLSSIAQWGYINAIVGFISLGLTIVNAFAANSRSGNGAKGANTLSVFITVVISLILNITLIGAASYLKKGLNGLDQGYFNLGMLKLASYFKIFGIIMIIALVIVSLAILLFLFSGAGATGGIK